MGKKVVVIAAGLTEREALPHLTKHLIESGVSIIDVRIPPRNRPLIPRQARDLITATWWDLFRRGAAPDKFVVLIDADGKSPDAKVTAFQDVCDQLREIPAPRLVTAAQWHLEAWFFALCRRLFAPRLPRPRPRHSRYGQSRRDHESKVTFETSPWIPLHILYSR
jgi:hypothetical protein